MYDRVITLWVGSSGSLDGHGALTRNDELPGSVCSMDMYCINNIKRWMVVLLHLVLYLFVFVLIFLD